MNTFIFILRPILNQQDRIFAFSNKSFLNCCYYPKTGGKCWSRTNYCFILCSLYSYQNTLICAHALISRKTGGGWEGQTPDFAVQAQCFSNYTNPPQNLVSPSGIAPESLPCNGNLICCKYPKQDHLFKCFTIKLQRHKLGGPQGNQTLLSGVQSQHNTHYTSSP